MRLDNRIYRAKNKEKLNKYRKEYYKANYETLKAKRSTPEFKAKKKAYRQEYDSKQENRDKRNAKRRERMKTDPEYKLKNVLRARLSNSLKPQNARKHSKTTELLGCTIQEFKVYIESLWEPWMNWSNHGYDYLDCWHIDHILPCASFDLTDPEQQKQCFHYTNLRPLRGIDNIRKRDSIE